MFKFFSRLFSKKKSKNTEKPGVVSVSAERCTGSSSFVFTRNGQTVYEEKDGKVIIGSPEDKAEGERVSEEIRKSLNDAVRNNPPLS